MNPLTGLPCTVNAGWTAMSTLRVSRCCEGPMSGDNVTSLKWWGYDQRWVGLFAVAERELRAVLALFVVEIEHIGSSAVPGLAARPVIDIQVGVWTVDDSAEILAAVESLGYEYVPKFEDELPDRRYFRRWANGRRSHQIRLVDRSNTDWWDRHVLGTGFATTTMIAIGMRNSKHKLASTHRNDGGAYTDGRSHFVCAMEEKSTPGTAQPSQHGSWRRRHRQLARDGRELR